MSTVFIFVLYFWCNTLFNVIGFIKWCLGKLLFFLA